MATVSRDRFAREWIASLRRAGYTGTLRLDRKRFRLIFGPGDDDYAKLENGFREYAAARPRDRQELIRHWTRAFLFCYRPDAVPQQFADAKHDLLLRLSPREIHRVDPGTDSSVMAAYTVGEHLALDLVYDARDVMIGLSRNRLREWGVRAEDAFEVARDNLLRLSDQRFVLASPGVWVSPWQDNYDSTRLALPELIRQLPVTGDPIAMVPNRDTLIITGSEDEMGLASMVGLVQQAKRQPRFLTGLAVQLIGRTWTPFLPARDRPAYPELKTLFIEHMAAAYAEQKTLLDAEPEDDLHITTYNLAQWPGSPEVFSYSVWEEGVSTLLLQTDLVGFVNKERDAVWYGEWDQVREIVGDLMQPLGMYPERFRVEEFPSPEQLREFKELRSEGW
jgi:hypothetical protein